MTTTPEGATRDGGSLPDAPGYTSEQLDGPSRAPRQLMSLRECAERLAQDHELGKRAPAHVTLKRWSAGGVLDEAKANQSGRPLYDMAKVRKICREQLAGRFDSPSYIDSGAGDPSTGGMPAAAGAHAEPGASAGQAAVSQIADVQAINERFDRIEQSILQLANTFQAALGEVMSQVARCAQASENLDSVRRTLQLRTDGEMTALRGQLAQALTATKRSPEGEQAQVLMKLGVELRGMAQRMEDIWSVLDKGHKHR